MVEKESFTAKIGPQLREVLNKQRANIKHETLDVCESSDWEAGEILAKKVIANNLI